MVFLACWEAWYVFPPGDDNTVFLGEGANSSRSIDRTLLDGPHIEFNGLLIHGFGRVVCGKKSHCEGDVVGYVFGPGWYSAVRAIEDYCLIIGIYIMNVYSMYSMKSFLGLMWYSNASLYH